MKVIFSRKGFDSSYGGFPSIILPDGQMISFPIPEKGKKKTMNETDSKIKGIEAENLKFILADKKELSLKEIFEKYNIQKIKIPGNTPTEQEVENTIFHYDPQIQNVVQRIYDQDNNKIINITNEYAAFGQSRAAASHLLNQKISKDDVFLFFGTFKWTGKDKKNRKEFHALWGYMIVDDVFNIDNEFTHFNGIEDYNNPSSKYPNLKFHPHYNNKKHEGKKNIIICSKRFGTFIFDEDKLKLTENDSTKSHWKIPNFWKISDKNAKITMTYNTNNLEEILDDGNLKIKSASIGQEFVINKYNPEIMKDWLEKILGCCNKKTKKKLKIENNSLVWDQQ